VTDASFDPPAWVRDAVFYQIFPDRFASSPRVPKPGPLQPWDAPPTFEGFKGGDLLGIVERLDELADLGITALYLNPVFASASNHRYHTDDYQAIDPLLGGDAAFRELVDTCHARGMRVVLDGVFNHCGRGFWPFHHVVEAGAGSPYRHWFHVDQARLDAGLRLRPYPTEAEIAAMQSAAIHGGLHSGQASERYLGYRAWWDLPALPKLNTNEPHMREYLMDVAEHWIRFGADGWRLDVAEEVDAGFWREFRARVRAADPAAYIVAEIWHVAPHWLTGDTFDALMHYPLAEAIIGFAAGSNLDREVVAAHDQFSRFLRPLDGDGFLSELDRLMAAYRPATRDAMLNLLGSHDTPRLRTVCGGDVASVRLATLLQMTLPGAPSVYYGDELGMEGRGDPDCRRAYPVDIASGDLDLRAFVQGAIALRHRYAALRAGGVRTLAASGSSMAYLRSDDSDVVVIAVNAGAVGVGLPLGIHEGTGDPKIERLPGQSDHRMGPSARWLEDGRLQVEVAARDATVVRLAHAL
jgi:cyclomaltodextrinase